MGDCCGHIGAQSVVLHGTTIPKPPVRSLAKLLCLFWLLESWTASAGDDEKSYGDIKYWETRYADPKERSKNFEWYGNWATFGGFVEKHVGKKDSILVAGCGNSNVSLEMHKNGFAHVLSVDFSTEVIASQKERFPHLSWQVANLRRMPEIPTGSFNAVFDKGTLDAVRTWKKGPEHREMLSEISRVLKPGGIYLLISFGPPDQLDTKFYLRNMSYGWTVATSALPKPHGNEGEVHHIYICQKVATSDTHGEL